MSHVYVDTFEDEERIDLNAVAQDIKLLDAEIARNDEVISRFCQELGIETPI